MMAEIVQNFRWQDAADILAVAVILYWILVLIRGTRAVQIVFGLTVLGAAFLLAETTGMMTLSWFLKSFLGSLVVVVVVLFQNEIRRALALVGTNPLTGASPREQEHLIDEIVKASTALSGKRIGALIAVERSTGLKNFIERGIAIDGRLTKELLLSVFMPFSPIHDGAVVISDGKVAAARVFLPLTANPRLEKVVGTRHRAALGLSEETDAVVLVVSEETGRVSLAVGGTLHTRLDPEALKAKLEDLLSQAGGTARPPLKERLKGAGTPSQTAGA